MRPVSNRGVTQPGYVSDVTRLSMHKRSSEASSINCVACYAILRISPLGRACAQARASACVCMRVLRNYVTKKEEKKKDQVRPPKRRYAGRYAGVTCHVTALDLPSSQIRAEVTHA